MHRVLEGGIRFWTSGGTTTYMFRDRYPQFEYETENGILTAVIYRLESGTGNEVQAIPDGNVLSLALYAFAGAETKYLHSTGRCKQQRLTSASIAFPNFRPLSTALMFRIAAQASARSLGCCRTATR